MSQVEAENVQKRIKQEREEAQLAHATHQFFKESPQGKLLLKKLEHETGANFSAFTGKDNFNAHSAAFRDGMRATFLIIENLIKTHESATKSQPES